MGRERLPVQYVPVVLIGFLGVTLVRIAVLSPSLLGRVLGLHVTVASLAIYTAWSLVATGLLVALLRRAGYSLEDLGWRRVGFKAVWEAAGAVGVAVLAWLPWTEATRAAGIPLYWDVNRRGFVQLSTGRDVVGVVLLGVLLVPIFEETLYPRAALSVEGVRWRSARGAVERLHICITRRRKAGTQTSAPLAPGEGGGSDRPDPGSGAFPPPRHPRSIVQAGAEAACSGSPVGRAPADN